MVKRREKTVFKTNKKETLKRKLYIAAIKGLMTLVVMAVAYTWLTNRSMEVKNKRIEKNQISLV